jgi:hypothetical protein
MLAANESTEPLKQGPRNFPYKTPNNESRNTSRVLCVAIKFPQDLEMLLEDPKIPCHLQLKQWEHKQQGVNLDFYRQSLAWSHAAVGIYAAARSIKFGKPGRE